MDNKRKYDQIVGEIFENLRMVNHLVINYHPLDILPYITIIALLLVGIVKSVDKEVVIGRIRTVVKTNNFFLIYRHTQPNSDEAK